MAHFLKGLTKLIVSLFLVSLLNSIAAYFSMGVFSDWYKNLIKPSWMPPSEAFPWIWGIIYILMGISLWLAWMKSKNERPSFLPFALQFVMNAVTTYCLFSMQSLWIGFVCIIMLLIFVFWTWVTFKKASAVAGYLLVPYFLWMLYATSFFIGLLALNT